MQRRTLLKNLGILSGGLILSKPASSQPALDTKPIRIAHITDMHLQPLIGAAKGFEKCLHHIQSHKIVPDFIINGGDAIMGGHKASESAIIKQWKLYNDVIQSENDLSIHNCVGNHDIYRRSHNLAGFEEGKKVATDKLELTKPYYSIIKQNWKIIVLDSVQGKEQGYEGKIDDIQMEWLKSELKNTPKDYFIMIASHIPIVSACVYFDGKNFKDGAWRVPESWMHSDAEDLVELFHKYSNIKLAISGHIHLQDRVVYNNITYCCNGAVSGNWWKGSYKQTHPGYALIDLFEDGTFENQYIKYS